MPEDYQFIGYHLLNSTAIQDYTTKIYHGNIPETETGYPVINYFMVSRPLIGDGAGERPRYQISCRSDDPGEVMQLANQVRNIFMEIQNSIGGFDVQNTHFEGATFLREPDNIYHIPVDIFVTYIH